MGYYSMRLERQVAMQEPTIEELETGAEFVESLLGLRQTIVNLFISGRNQEYNFQDSGNEHAQYLRVEPQGRVLRQLVGFKYHHGESYLTERGWTTKPFALGRIAVSGFYPNRYGTYDAMNIRGESSYWDPSPKDRWRAHSMKYIYHFNPAEHHIAIVTPKED